MIHGTWAITSGELSTHILPVCFIAQVQQEMVGVRPLHLIVWFTGFLSGSLWPHTSGPSTSDLSLLSQELRTTRIALEENSDHSCRAELHSEIRYSAGLRVTLQGLTLLQAAVYLWVCFRRCCRSQTQQDRPGVQTFESSSSESEGVVPEPTVSKSKGPVRPSDLKRIHG